MHAGKYCPEFEKIAYKSDREILSDFCLWQMCRYVAFVWILFVATYSAFSVCAVTDIVVSKTASVAESTAWGMAAQALAAIGWSKVKPWEWSQAASMFTSAWSMPSLQAQSGTSVPFYQPASGEADWRKGLAWALQGLANTYGNIR